MIIPYGAFAFVLLGSGVYFVKMHHIVRKMGRHECWLPQRSRRQFVGILVCTLILVILPLVRRYDLLIEVSVCALGVIGFLIALRDILYAHRNGLYENGFIFNGIAVFFADIVSCARIDPDTLVIQTRRHTHHSIVPDNDDTMSVLISHIESSGIPLQ